MATHIKVLAWLQIVYGLLGSFMALMIFAGTLISLPFAGSLTNSTIVGITGTFVSMLFGVTSLLHLVAGWGLLARKSWARILSIVLGVISLIRFPFGTAVGIYALWVLMSKDGAAQFEATSA